MSARVVALFRDAIAAGELDDLSEGAAAVLLALAELADDNGFVTIVDDGDDDREGG